MTLVEIARQAKPHKETKIGLEQIELALGWTRGEYGITAVSRALGHKKLDVAAYCAIARALREGFAQGRLVDRGEPAKDPRREYP